MPSAERFRYDRFTDLCRLDLGTTTWPDSGPVPALRTPAEAVPLSLRRRYKRPRRTTVKETKFFRKQADKAERIARSASDSEMSQQYLNMARAYRAQAEVLKAKKKATKKQR